MGIKGITKEQLAKALVNTVNNQEIEQKQKGFLCMFSGGLDSTAMLHGLLTNPKYEHFNVYVHHINFINRENRHLAELEAARNIVQYYHDRKDIRAFDYKESTFDTSTMDRNWSSAFPYDMDVTCFMAAQVCRAKPQIKYVGIAVPKDDFIENNPATLARIKHAPEVFSAALYHFPPEIPRPVVIYPTQNLMKKQLWQSLPGDVRKHIWYCRTPVWVDKVPTKCGKCHTCKQMTQSGLG